MAEPTQSNFYLKIIAQFNIAYVYNLHKRKENIICVWTETNGMHLVDSLCLLEKRYSKYCVFLKAYIWGLVLELKALVTALNHTHIF